MPIPKRRMISFRLSEDEYHELRTLCAEHDSRTLSDIARFAIEQLVRNHSVLAETQLERQVQDLRQRVTTLDQKIEQIAAAVGGSLLSR